MDSELELRCLRCGAFNVKGQELKITLAGAKAHCVVCGNVFRWPPKKRSE